MPSTLPAAQQEELIEMAKSSLAAMGLTHGIQHTELKYTSRGARLLEVNPRMGGKVGGRARGLAAEGGSGSGRAGRSGSNSWRVAVAAAGESAAPAGEGVGGSRAGCHDNRRGVVVVVVCVWVGGWVGVGGGGVGGGGGGVARRGPAAGQQEHAVLGVTVRPSEGPTQLTLPRPAPFLPWSPA